MNRVFFYLNAIYKATLFNVQPLNLASAEDYNVKMSSSWSKWSIDPSCYIDLSLITVECKTTIYLLLLMSQVEKYLRAFKN